MNSLIIIFCISLAGIAVMISRKLVLVRELSASVREEKIIIEIPKLREIKDSTLKQIKKYSFVILVLTIRIYVKSSNFLKKRSSNVINKVKTKLVKKNIANDVPEKPEVSKFLKMISEYKQKIKRIKRRIKEEEKEE